MGESVAAVISACQADETLAALGSYRFAALFQHGSLDVGIYAPVGVDNQRPHTRDEVYVVRAGTARFVTPDLDRTIGSGDLLFVPAHSEHRFEGMSGDFSCWVLFYGPEGGETAP
jgi:mannose-6-phosphate isomerase-like protein (cupin superfamily)